jgi:hypothetical protein
VCFLEGVGLDLKGEMVWCFDSLLFSIDSRWSVIFPLTTSAPTSWRILFCLARENLFDKRSVREGAWLADLLSDFGGFHSPGLFSSILISFYWFWMI